MRTASVHLVRRLAALAFVACGEVWGVAMAEPGAGVPVRVAVYEAAPYGSVGANGVFVGASVDLWRRVAEDHHWAYRLEAVAKMEDVLAGLEHGRFDAAIGAITITPERLARVDFSYPTHRSGVTVAFRKQTGLSAALSAYGSVASQLGLLIATMVVMLLFTGAIVWLFERRPRGAVTSHESAITTLHEGIYWAVVTMTTVGYGDKTPKTHAGRIVAVLWMLGSVALISLLSTCLVAQLTADRIAKVDSVRQSDLAGKRLAAVEGSSGAEYLAASGLAFTKVASLNDALTALTQHRVDGVVNSIGALEYAVATGYATSIELPRGLLAPALMGVALPPLSPLMGPLDQSLVKITTGPEWPAIEARYFGG